jgi:hypothetical protein
MDQHPIAVYLAPLDSPDFASSDFDLLGYVKVCLIGYSFAHAGELLEAVKMILNGIRKETLQAIFLDWMERLRACIVTNGDYIK